MSGAVDYAQEDAAIAAELRAVTWIYKDRDGTPKVGNLLDGCPCLGWRYRQRCKHYDAAADAYSLTTGTIVGSIIDVDD